MSPGVHTSPSQSWELELSDDGFAWTPFWTEGRLFLVGASSPDESGAAVGTTSVRRVDPEDGRTHWQRELVGEPGAPRMVSTPAVYVLQQGAAVEAIDAVNGTYKWGIEYEERPLAIGAAGSTFAAMLPQGILNVRALASGAQRWTLDLDGWEIRRFAPADGGLMGLATHKAQPGVLAVFDLSLPIAEPAWTVQAAGSPSAFEIENGLLVGRFDGRDRVLSLADGAVVAELTSGSPSSLVGGLLLRTESVEGVVLRMQRVSAFSPAAPSTPVWRQTLAGSQPMSTILSAPDLSRIVLFSDDLATVLDTGTGGLIQHMALSNRDVQGRECTVLGTTGRSVVRRCQDMTRRVVSAIAVEPE